MSLQTYIDGLVSALAAGQRIEDVMRADEAAKGYRVVRPGEVSWLPAADWDYSVVVSLDKDYVRLVAILARNPGNGAFRRLIANISAAGLTPCVLAPTNEMRATVKRWGWRSRYIGHGFDCEERWYPRRK